MIEWKEQASDEFMAAFAPVAASQSWSGQFDRLKSCGASCMSVRNESGVNHAIAMNIAPQDLRAREAMEVAAGFKDWFANADKSRHQGTD